MVLATSSEHGAVILRALRYNDPSKPMAKYTVGSSRPVGFVPHAFPSMRLTDRLRKGNVIKRCLKRHLRRMVMDIQRNVVVIRVEFKAMPHSIFGYT
jgi:hypothetical protein